MPDTARVPDDVASVIPSGVVAPRGTMFNIPRFYAIASGRARRSSDAAVHRNVVHAEKLYKDADGRMVVAHTSGPPPGVWAALSTSDHVSAGAGGLRLARGHTTSTTPLRLCVLCISPAGIPGPRRRRRPAIDNRNSVLATSCNTDDGQLGVGEDPLGHRPACFKVFIILVQKKSLIRNPLSAMQALHSQLFRHWMVHTPVGRCDAWGRVEFNSRSVLPT